MRILYIDIDCLRPDHLGCYGYHRDTSPALDRIAARGLRFDNVYASDTPCLPSRSALFSGRFGIHTGAIGHGGTAADPFIEGRERSFSSNLGRSSWMRLLRDAGYHTVTISPFAERHSAWHFYANFNEVHNTGKRGLETADEIAPACIDWIARHGARDDWFVHVNLWDPHTPYRTPTEYGEPFGGAPLPSWYSEEVRRAHWRGVGPHSAREVNGYDDAPGIYRPRWPRHPLAMDSMDSARMLFDGYDTGVRYADDWVARIVEALESAGIADDTAILISADHGENLGELNVYGDHQTADQHTARVPFIVAWPGVTDGRAGQVDRGLYYQIDLAATVVEWCGGAVKDNWDGASFAATIRGDHESQKSGREFLVLSHGAWSCQRAVRFRDMGQDGAGEFLCIRSYHDGYHLFPDVMLFDLARDPHEEHDLADDRRDLIGRAMAHLDVWHGEAMRRSDHDVDPMWTVMREGGPKHTRGMLSGYLERLRQTDRAQQADVLAVRHPREL